MNFDYVIKVLKADMEYMIEIESPDRVDELKEAISILEAKPSDLTSKY